MSLDAGQIILNGRYHILRLLGEGGMGRVWLAEDTLRALQVAIKEPRPDLSGSEAADLAERFRRSMRLSGALFRANVPNIVRVITVEEGDGPPLLVMEYCGGGSLKERLAQSGPLAVEAAVRITLDLLAALSVVHEKLAWVHRDIKPGNILFTEDGQARLADFDLAQMGESGRSQGGQPHPGTPGYMSPEQEEKTGYLAPASDLFSLASVLFEMLTGKAYKRVRPGTSASSLRPDVPAWLDAVLAKALQIDQWDRYETAAQMAAALSSGLSGQAAARAEAEQAARRAAEAEAARQAQAAAEARGKIEQEAADRIRVETEQRAQEACQRSEAEERQRASEPLFRHIDGQTAQAPEPAPPKTARAPWLVVGVLAALLVILAAANGGFDGLFATPTATPVPPTVTRPHAPAATLMPTRVATGATPVPTRASTATPVPPPADMVRVPAGEFTMGSDTGDGDEKPVHTVYLDEFWIDKTEVTNAAFARFVQASGYKTTAEQPNHPGGYVLSGSSWAQVKGADWQHPSGPSSSVAARQNYPVIQVSWDDAVAYCTWAGKRLPTEAEWEKAARGTDGRVYPWGNTWDSGKANTSDSGVEDSVAVGSYPAGASPYGVLDMAGNVWEWVADWYDAGYYGKSPARNPTGPSAGEYRVVRGGSWYFVQSIARAANRLRFDPANVFVNFGFRCARGSPL